MTSLYYEQCVVNSPKVSTKELIKLSEHQRAFNKKPTLKSAEMYLEKYKKLLHKVRYRRVQLKEHPTFTYKSVKVLIGRWNFFVLLQHIEIFY